MTDNAVLRLRQDRLDRATRPFLARGSRAVRCQGCLLPQQNCLCATIKPLQANSRFCLITFGAEPLKPSNTGRLIADILPDTLAFTWSRTEVDPGLLAAINNPARQPSWYSRPLMPMRIARWLAACPQVASRLYLSCSTVPGRKRAKCSVKAPI